MKQYDIVRVIKDDLKQVLQKEQIGTILDDYAYADNHFEIEIFNINGTTIFMRLVSGKFLEVV